MSGYGCADGEISVIRPAPRDGAPFFVRPAAPHRGGSKSE